MELINPVPTAESALLLHRPRDGSRSRWAGQDNRVSQVGQEGGKWFDCGAQGHKGRVLAEEEFKREMERHLTGQETKAWDISYFKVNKSRLPVIEHARETAALMLRTDKSRGYCLEMICADFLAGANLENGNSNALLFSRSRLYQMLPAPVKKEFLNDLRKAS